MPQRGGFTAPNRWFRHGTMPVLARRLLGRRVIVADPGETGDDLVRDMIDVLASFWARLYGRGVRNHVLRALARNKANTRGGPRRRRGRLRMGVRPMFEVPDGWVARGFVFEVATTSLEQPARVAQAFGARRYAYNWALGQVKANLDARTADPTARP
jgi:Helix-turn-helix domain